MDGDENHAMGRTVRIQVRGGGFARVGDIMGRTYSNSKTRTADVASFNRERRERGGVYGYF